MQDAGLDHRTVQTSRMDEIVMIMRGTFGRIEVRRDDERSLSLRMRSSIAPGLRTTRWSMSGRCSGVLDRLDDERPPVLTGIGLGGDIAMLAGSGALDTTQPYLCPDRFDWRLTSTDIVNVALDRPVLDAAAGALVGTEPFAVRFTGFAPIDAVRSRAWRDTVAYASRMLEVLESDTGCEMLRTAVVDTVGAVLLQTFPNTALELAERGSTRPSEAVRRAQQYIDEHLADPIHPIDLARAGGISLRGLHAAFRREVDVTPMAYVRAARLSAARKQLEDGAPADLDVGALALRWGFTSARQFAARYAQAYHETPLETLHR